MIRALATVIAALVLTFHVSAQVNLNGQELVTSTGTVTNAMQNVPDSAGTAYIDNFLSVAVTLELRQVGVVKATMGISANSTLDVPTGGLAVGVYEIWGYEAGKPGTAVKLGTFTK